jgi:hypothetical protein
LIVAEHASGGKHERAHGETDRSRVSAQRTADTGELLPGGGADDGRVRYREDIVEGLENAPAAFIGTGRPQFREGARSRRALGLNASM